MLIENNGKTKSFSVRAIMKDRKMVQMLDEALKSPVGSTKRQQAKSMLSSLTTVKKNNMYVEDGMGGFMDSPGVQAIGNFFDAAGNKISDVAQSAQQWGSDILGSGREAASGAAQYLGENIPKAGEKLAGYASEAITGDPSGARNVAYTPYAETGGAEELLDRWRGRVPQSKAVVNGFTLPDQKLEGDALTALDKANAPGTYIGKSPEQIKTEQDSRYAGYEERKVTSDDPFIYGTDQEGIDKATKENPDAINDWLYNQGSTINLTGQYSTIQDAVNKGLGANTTAYKIMSDRNELRKLFPNTPEDDLPIGASLTRQIGDLKNTLKEEYKVDELLKNVTDLTNRNLGVENDMNAYIRGRDEYLKKIDNMIDNVKDEAVTMDLSNPNTAKKMKQYSDYLYILKGRQNQRYADFVQTSIDQADNELTQAQNLYNTQLSAFEEAFKTEGSITVEDYNTLKTMITEMYDNLDGQYEKSLDLGILENELAQADLETLKLSTEAAGGWSSFDPITQFEQTYYLGNLGMDKNKEKTGEEKSSDMYGLMNKAKRDGFSSERQKEQFIANVRRDFLSGANNASWEDNLSFYNKTMNDVGSKAAYDTAITNEEELFDSSYASDADQVARSMSGGLATGLKNYFEDKDQGDKRIKSLKDMINDLTGSGIFNKKEAKREDWGKDNKDDLSDAIWNMWNVKLETGESSFFDGFNSNMPTDDLTNSFINELSTNTYMKYLSEFTDSFLNNRQ